MKLKFLISVILSIILFSGCSNNTNNSIKIITDRSDFHLTSITKQFEIDNGVKIDILYLQEGLLSRLESKREADIVIVKNSSDIIEADKRGLLAKIKPEQIENVPDKFKEDKWFNMSYRIRAFYIQKELKEYPTTYEDLADPKYKGMICIRPFTHTYNLVLIGNILAKHGKEYTAKWLQGLKNNLARYPSGNDRAQVKGIYDGDCKIAIGNTYYMGLMLENIEQKAWAENVNLIIPNQNTYGGIALYSGVALTKKGFKNELAEKFLSYLVNPLTQQYISSVNYEYPIVGESGSNMVKSFGNSQGIDIKDIKINNTKQELIASEREDVFNLIKNLK